MPELATETTDTFLQADGSYEFVGYTHPVNYLTADGDWEPIDNEFVPAAGDAFAVENAENDFLVRMPEDADADPIKVITDKHWVTFEMDDLSGAPTVDGTEATYTNAGQDASAVVYEALSDGVKESILLNQPPTGDVEYAFDLDLSAGLTPKLRATGAIEIVDSSSRPTFTLPAPFMIDANDAVSTDVEYMLTDTATGWRLVVTPSVGWLRDPDRAYPVVVDPTLVVNPSSDGWIAEANPDTVNGGGAYLRVGGVTGSRRRALLKFDVTGIPSDAVIQSTDDTDPAVLKLSLDAGLTEGDGTVGLVAGRIKSSQTWTPGNLSWNSRDQQTPWETPGGAWDTPSPIATVNLDASGYKSIDVREAVEKWVHGWANNGFIVKQDTNADNTLWFHSVNTTTTNPPKLVIKYQRPPDAPKDLSITPGGVGYTTELNPSLSVKVRDPDGTLVDTTFTIMDQTNSEVWHSTVTGTPSGQTARAQVPEDILDPGADYTLSVTSTSAGLASMPLTSQLRADVFAAVHVDSSSCTDCVPLTPTSIFSGSIPANGSVSVPISGIPVELDNLVAVRVRVDLGSHGQTGGLGVYRDDYPTPIAPVINFVADAQASVLEVIPSAENTFGLRNYSGSPATVSVSALSWVPAVTDAEAQEEQDLENAPLTDAENAAIDAEQEPTVVSEPPLDQEDIAEIGLTPDLNGTDDQESCKPTAEPGGTFCMQTLSSAAALEAAVSGGTPPITTEAERAGFSGCPFGDWNLLRKSACTHLAFRVRWDFDDDDYDSVMVWQAEVKVTTSNADTSVHYRVRLLLSKRKGWFATPHALRIKGKCGGECYGDGVSILTNHFDEDNPRQTIEWSFQRRPVDAGARVTGRQHFGIELYPDGAADAVVTSWINIPLIRCDFESYVSRSQGMGCVYVGFRPTFHLSTREGSGPYGELKELAANVLKGIYKMRFLGYGIRGGGAIPLQRLRNDEKIRKNRAEAGKICRRKPPRADTDCDEYPMASTYQGCFVKRDWELVGVTRCHAARVDSTQNQAGGRKLNDLNLSQRILDGDRYYVYVHQ